MPAPVTGPDVQQLQDQVLPEGSFPGGLQQRFRVFISPEVHQEIWKHAQEDTNVEICGVLVGNLAKDQNGPFVNVSASIRGEAAAKKFAEVTFTHETWANINAEMDSKYADRSIVGWYHTHPDFGIFLSDRDRFIQENFFSGPGQIALVVDPIRICEGIFIWEAGKPVMTPHFWVGDKLTTSNDGSGRTGNAAPQSEQTQATATVAPLYRTAPDWVGVLQTALLSILMLMAGWLLAGRLNDFMLTRARQEGVAMAVYQLGMRPELDIRLSELGVDLQVLADNAKAISADHANRLNEKDVAKEDVENQLKLWKDVELRLNRSMQLVERINREYCLDTEQKYLLNQILANQTVNAGKSKEPRSARPEKTSNTTDLQPKSEKPVAPEPAKDNAAPAKDISPQAETQEKPTP